MEIDNPQVKKYLLFLLALASIGVFIFIITRDQKAKIVNRPIGNVKIITDSQGNTGSLQHIFDGE